MGPVRPDEIPPDWFPTTPGVGIALAITAFVLAFAGLAAAIRHGERNTRPGPQREYEQSPYVRRHGAHHYWTDKEDTP